MRNNKGFVVSAVLYPLLVLFLALIMGFLSLSDTRKRILDRMKLEITDSIFDEASCSCDTIMNKLNFIIKNGISGSGGTAENLIKLNIKLYDSFSEVPTVNNTDNDIAIISDTLFMYYYITDIEPSSPQSGDLWIHVRQGAPNYLQSDTVKVPVAYIEQYIDGEWTYIESAVWSNKQWNKLDYTEGETATKDTIVNGYTAIVNGEKVTGALDISNSYFEISDSSSNVGYLGGQPVTADALVYAGNKYDRDFYKLVVSSTNASGVKTQIVLGTDSVGDSSTYNNSSSCTGTWTDSVVVLNKIVQVSPYIVAVFWEKDTEVYNYQNGCYMGNSAYSEISSDIVTAAYYVSTFYLDGTTLTKKDTKQLNTIGEISRNYRKKNYQKYVDGSDTYQGQDLYTGNSQTTSYWHEVSEDFQNHLGGTSQYLKWYQFSEESTYKVDYDADDTSSQHDYETKRMVNKDFCININNGTITVYTYDTSTDSSGNTTYSYYYTDVKNTYNSYTGKMDSASVWDFWAGSLYAITYTSNPECGDSSLSRCNGTEKSVSVHFQRQASYRTSVSISSSSVASLEYYDKFKSYSSYRYSGLGGNWYLDYRIRLNVKKFSLTLYSVASKSSSVIYNDSTSEIYEDSVSVDLSNMLGSSKSYSTACWYSDNIHKILCTVKGYPTTERSGTPNGYVFITLGISEGATLNLVLENVSYRDKLNGTLYGTEALDGLNNNVVRYYR
jgi:hypothetical protein